MSIEMLSEADAIVRIRSVTQRAGQVLGVDRFQILKNGYIGRLDLILDLSSCPMTAEQAEAKALLFVAAHAGRDIMFEVVDTLQSDS
jgi:hypothetical protein